MPSLSEQHDYPTTNTTVTSYYQHSSPAPTSPLTTLTTLTISKTATVTITSVEFITSQSTFAAPAPTSAPAVSSTDVGSSPGKIAGAILGAIFGTILLLIFILYLFYIRRFKFPSWSWPCNQEGPDQRPTLVPVTPDTTSPPGTVARPRETDKDTSKRPLQKRDEREGQEDAELAMSLRPSSIQKTPPGSHIGLGTRVRKMGTVFEREGSNGELARSKRDRARGRR